MTSNRHSPNPADLSAVNRALRRAYPDALLKDVDSSAFDECLPEIQLWSLLDEIAEVPSSNAVFEHAVLKRHILRIGLNTGPDWEELNRALSGSARVAAVRESREGIFYWNLLLSRLAPFWTGYWNVFRVRGARVYPELTSAQESPPWPIIQQEIRQILSTYGLREVRKDLRDAPVKWLWSTEVGSGRPVSVYDALFADV